MHRALRRQLVGLLRAALGALLLAGCAPKVHLLVLDAPDLRLPDEVRRVAVTHRVTGGDGAMAQAAEAAVAGFAQALGQAPGLTAVPTRVVGAWPDGPLPAQAAVDTCAAAGADAVVVLETLRSDTDLQLDETPAVDPEAEPDVHAQRTSRVHATWRMLDRSGRALDELGDVVIADRWSTAGPAAGAAVPEARDSFVDLGRSSGIAYAHRVAPSWVSVTRTYYVSGDPRLREGARRLQVADWEGALDLFDAVARSTRPPRVRARALHDLALGWEVLGRPLAAVRAAEEAAALHDSPRIQRYLEVLHEQRTASRLLREPLAQQETSEDP